MILSLKSFFLQLIENERPRWILWLPVGLGTGIGLYFSCSAEPALSWLLLPFIMGLLALRWAWLWPGVVIAVGFGVALGKSTLLSTFQLHKEQPPCLLQGTIEKVEMRSKDVRLTLGDLYQEEGKALKIARVRLSCRGSLCQDRHLYPGQVIRVRSVLLPPPEPPHPYGYDFRRHAYFEGLGAVGYVIEAPHLIKDNQPGTRKLAYLRHHLTQFLRSQLKGLTGEIAAALVTGDRSGIPEPLRNAFADAGVAHVLAISGLHLSLVAGFFFFLIRTLLALIPPVALRWNSKKIAAFWAFLGITGYLAICGAPLPAARSYIMTSLVLGAVMLDRCALSLRNVAIAATVLLLFIPEALISPSFQLSFAAVVVLIAGYENYYSSFQSWISIQPWLGSKVILYAAGIILSTLLSTLATTPYVVFTFHRFTLHAIPANMIIIPLVSFIIMPGLVLFLLLWPLSQMVGVNKVLEGSLSVMVWVAQKISGWQGSNIPLKAMPTSILILLTFGMLLFFLVKHTFRYSGLFLIALGLIGLWYNPLPTWFISSSGKLVGKYTLSSPLEVNTLQKDRFARKSWMTYCGHTSVVKNTRLFESLPPSLKKIFQETLAQSKRATYVWVSGNYFKYLSVRDWVGQRPWSLPLSKGPDGSVLEKR